MTALLKRSSRAITREDGKRQHGLVGQIAQYSVILLLVCQE